MFHIQTDLKLLNFTLECAIWKPEKVKRAS
jgi:hypothetical protein